MNRKSLVLALATCGLILAAYFSAIRWNSDTHVVVQRILLFNNDGRSVSFIVKGYYNSLLTYEGPYPAWSDDIMVTFNDQTATDQLRNPTKNSTFEFGRDFVSRIGSIHSGRILVNGIDHTATLEVEYADDVSYKKRINGIFELSGRIQ
jgi:hypothetical protein